MAATDTTREDFITAVQGLADATLITKATYVRVTRGKATLGYISTSAHPAVDVPKKGGGYRRYKVTTPATAAKALAALDNVAK